MGAQRTVSMRQFFFEHPKHMFILLCKKIITILRSIFFGLAGPVHIQKSNLAVCVLLKPFDRFLYWWHAMMVYMGLKFS